MSNKKTKSINWNKQIKKLKQYCKKIGYKINFNKLPDSNSYIEFYSKCIFIHSGLTLERQVYTILHELGHYIINVKNTKNYKDTLEVSYNEFSKKSNVYKIAEIEEEIEAWNNGLKLAKKLDLSIDRKKYHIYKSSLISTYITHFITKKQNRQDITETEKTEWLKNKNTLMN